MSTDLSFELYGILKEYINVGTNIYWFCCDDYYTELLGETCGNDDGRLSIEGHG